jgi:hypothetical protein
MITTFTTITVALITAVVGPIAVEWAKKQFSKKPKTTPMHDALEVSNLIDSQLEHLLEEINCDRIWVAQFHNGGYFYPTGRSIQKFSIFYEKLSIGTPPIQHTYQNIPVSLFPKVLSKVYNESELEVEDVNTSDGNCGLEFLTTHYKTSSICIIGLYSLEDQLIGALGISYKTPHKLTRDEWITLRQKSGVIGTLLSEYLYQTNKK